MTVSEHLRFAIQTARAAAAAELVERTGAAGSDCEGRDDNGRRSDAAPARADVLAHLGARAELVVSARVLPPTNAPQTRIEQIGNSDTLT